MAECDRLGSTEFLARYHFGRAPAYTLWQRGNEYDCKAILGVAYLRATGNAVANQEFTGGRDGAAGVLSDLGFDVAVDETLAAQAEQKALAAQARSNARAASRPAPAARPPRAPREPRAVSTRPKAAPVPRRPAPPEPKVCPHCHMAIPATGLCDNCD